MYAGQSRTFLGFIKFYPTWLDDCGSFIIVFSFKEGQYGLKKCYWNCAIKGYKKDCHREPQTFQMPSLEDLFDDSPISEGKHCSKTKSIELHNPAQRQNGFCRRLQVVCVADSMGLRVKITVAHRGGNDTETL